MKVRNSKIRQQKDRKNKKACLRKKHAYAYKISTREDCLQRITGGKPEKFEKMIKALKSVWMATQKRKCVAGRPYGIGELREHLLLLLIYYRTYTTHLFLAQIFHVDEATIYRAIRRIAQLAERVLKIKQERLLTQDTLKKLIVDATKQCIERPKISVIITRVKSD